MTEIRTIAIFGSSGKVGSALSTAFAKGRYTLVPITRATCDVRDHDQVRRRLQQIKPELVINAAAFNGVDACEKDPHQALLVNTLFPRLLAELSASQGFLLVHISSDAVFSGTGRETYAESSAASPINLYGFTKYGADCFITAIAHRYYIARISVQFGITTGSPQFVEKMLERMQRSTEPLRISNDIVASPSYSQDVATAIRGLVEEKRPFGLYHLVNEGEASLWELIQELDRIMGLKAAVKPVSHEVFPSLGLKNRHTPLRSEKVPPLRPWREALRAYCTELQPEKGRIHG
ncbi:NDP-hexose 4-oxoreductase, putative [Geotalea daltonii FRC-32]|uniref:dTDP-4-dehydrorhamnose reductase n=1 Tax=Geotalea daltonii (strain DSM 22248 / JCM 15807 / FRC-32) TaxID=316067 RepID=B9M0J1_GEODF|nr:NAD(P)-dependent oxidoreductase [Geotalea daltonii]ACM19028.1 NDP-hexose 4-oxoreductase, putative [Geotalea daltonii FRC-32]